MSQQIITTNVRLPSGQVRQLKLRAIEEGKSMGQVLREILAKVFGTSLKNEPKAHSRSLNPTNPFSSIATLGSSGVEDGATNHDKYLYGKVKNQWKK